jgi:hypothetical protein
MPPKLRRMTRLAYQAFPLDVFCKHIHQVTRSRTESSYGLVRKAKKAKTNVGDASTKTKQDEMGTLL